MVGHGGTSRAFRLIVAGDIILNHRVSVSDHPGFLRTVDLLNSADVVHAQLETPLVDPATADAYPAAEGGMSWFGPPPDTTAELRWLGIDIVSTASNHALDYSYGGLTSTLAALDAAAIPHAGSGLDLARARAPAFISTASARIGLVSACSSFPAWARAGAARPDVQGRPGVNPLRFHHRVDRQTAASILGLAERLGAWITRDGDELLINPPGLHNTVTRYVVSDEPGMGTVPDEDDLEGNRRAIRDARSQADFVIAHLHAHEWDINDSRASTSSEFIETYARAMIDEGAGVVIVQGAHAPMRGIEIHRGRPIFYDPGDLVKVGRPDRQPADYYARWGFGKEARLPDAGIAEAYPAGARMFGAAGRDFRVSPCEAYSREPGFFVPVCEVGEDLRISRISLHPMRWLTGTRQETGLPALCDGPRATEILKHLATLSEPYGTSIAIDGSVGYIAVPPAENAPG
jgi:poly-gamma-glutamate synthesis protein (capsule biosynthesis protein)